MANTSLNKLIEKSMKANWDRPALSDYKGKMGAGQVDAGAFLAAIAGEDAGRDMRF